LNGRRRGLGKKGAIGGCPNQSIARITRLSDPTKFIGILFRDILVLS
jgi:hypothetical protein